MVMSHGKHHHHGYKFNPTLLERLRDPERLRYLNPEAIWRVLGTQPIATLIDLGAGLGFFAIPFARMLPAGHVYACDSSAEMLEHLKAALREHGVSNVTPVLTEEVRVPLEDGLADAVLMANLHHELDRPEETLAECRRLLKPGGTLALIDWQPEPTPMGPPVEVRIPLEIVWEQLQKAGYQGIVRHDILPYHYFLTALA
jgi:ubiquinone/menaquinone biosynthesis C-methylase UbiE